MKLNQTFLNREWRLNHLYSIVDKKARRITYNQNNIQSRIANSLNKRKMILKARQFGVSTGCLIEQFDYVITKKNVTACILAHEQDSIKKLFRIPRRAYNYMNPKLMPVLDRGGGSKHEMYFPLLGSRIYCDLESRGDTIHWLHVSEMAFMKDPERLLATLQAVPMDGIVTIESTPNGMGNLFYEMWADPEQPYEKMFFPWFIYPEYRIIETDPLTLTEEEEALTLKVKKHYGLELTHAQVAFRRYKRKELGHLFGQEYPEDDQNCFLTSGNSPIDLYKVREQIEARRPPITTTSLLKTYKPYDKSKTYVCGVDCAEGVGGDYSVATIFEARSREQVACLRGNIKPHPFAQEIVDLCYLYTTSGRAPPLLAVERNNHGHGVILELEHHLHYPNLYRHRDERMGWLTDRVTRPIMVDTFINGVESKAITLNDLDTLQECLTLVNEDGKIQSAPGKHDDCVMASAIAVQMCIECATLDVYDNIKDKILV